MKATYLIIIILIVVAVIVGVYIMKSPAEPVPENNGNGEQSDVGEAISAIDSIVNDLDSLNSSASGLDENADLLNVFQGQ